MKKAFSSEVEMIPISQIDILNPSVAPHDKLT